MVATPALAADYDSPSKIEANGENTLTWTGQGTYLYGGHHLLKSLDCADTPSGYEETGYLLWIFTTDKGTVDGTPVLTINDTDTYNEPIHNGKSFHFTTPYYDLDTLTAYVTFNATDTGNGDWVLTISHGCSGGGGGPQASLTVTKTAETSYTRTHNWDIAKKVETENGYKEGDYPKIWLYTDGSGDETATWTVDVTYEGYDDSDFNVSGDITIENTGDEDVKITGVEDLLAGEEAEVTWEDEEGNTVTFDESYTLAVGEKLYGTYSEDVESMITGQNVVTVTTSLLDGEGNFITFDGYADIVWGDPTTEVNKTVSVKDISDLFGEVGLGTVTAPNNGQFTYDKDFAWADYGENNCGDYTDDNTATIVETGQSAEATLLVNVQCYIYETAYAYGGSGDSPALEADCFIPTFSNWGWTNYIATKPFTGTWNLWAGAGQCDATKGTMVGTVNVTYSADGYVTVTYNLDSPYILQETHVYAGTTKFPKVLQGKKLVDTVAPGQYYNNGPFSGPIYVIAHAIVGIPDPNFGP